jgi:hypothetical protein
LGIPASLGRFPAAFPRFSSSSVQLSPPSPENAAHIRDLSKFRSTSIYLVWSYLQNYKTRAAVQDRLRSHSFQLNPPPSVVTNTAAPMRGLSGVRSTSTRPIWTFSPSLIPHGGLHNYLMSLFVLCSSYLLCNVPFFSHNSTSFLSQSVCV